MSLLKNFLRKRWLLVILLVFWAWLFLNLLSSHMLLQKEQGLYSGGSTWGDLAIHLSYISSFTERGIDTLRENPIFSGKKLSYYFFYDLIGAILIKIGLNLRLSLIIPSFVFLIVLVALIYFLVLKITKSKIGAFLAPFIFFFNGTIFGLFYFWQDFKKSNLSFWEFLTNMTKEYAHLADYNIHFSNIVADYILPQRPIILGMVMGVLTIYFLWNYWDGEGKKNLLKAGAIVSFLPVIHIHTFMTLIMVAGFLVLIQFLKDVKSFKKNIFEWIYFALPVLIIALPLLFLILPAEKNFLRFEFGWMKENENFLWFWLKNLGIHLFVFIAAFFFARPRIKTFYLAFLGVFLVSNLIIFQPYNYDNMKIMLWWFLLSIILAAEFFQKLIKVLSWKGYLIVILIFILLIPTGVLSVWRESYASWLMFSNEDLKIADFVKKNTPKDALFLTSDKHNHPIPTLSGRRILMGYRGWLWTHGINYIQREKDVSTIFQGGPSAEHLLKNYKVDFVYIGPEEIHNFQANKDFFDKNYPLFFRTETFAIYKINSSGR